MLFRSLLIVIEEFRSLVFAMDPASIVFVTVPVSPVVIAVPVTSGRVNVLDAVRVVGVIVTANVPVPAALPSIVTPSYAAEDLNVFAPASTCVPVVIIPEAETEADGIAAYETADIPEPVSEPVGPAVVPPVHENAVG